MSTVTEQRPAALSSPCGSRATGRWVVWTIWRGLLLATLGVLVVLGCTSPEPDSTTPATNATPPASATTTPSTTDETSAVTETPSSIVLISIDTLRSDHLPIYGYDGVETPAIDALAADGTVYERAYTHVPLTLPAHVSLFTGLLPPEHGVRDNIGYRFDAGVGPYVPRALQAAGYATAAAVSAYVLRGDGGLAEGFDLYDDAVGPRGRRGAGGVQRAGTATLDSVRPWLEARDPESPFFLFLHLFEPHTPYTPPPPFDRFPLAYDGEIAAADAVVGQLVELLRREGLYDGTTILLLSDHGEGLGDHGEDEHGVLLYREVLQVPLVVKRPAVDGASAGAGGRVATPVQLVDVAATLFETAGLAVPDEVVGLPLPQVTDSGSTLASEEPRALYAETYYPRFHFGWSELTSLIEGSKHYIHGPDPELYDLVDDPGETLNLLGEERATARRLRDRLATLAVPATAPDALDASDPEAQQALAALGYVTTTGGSPETAGTGPLPDPKSRLGSVVELRACLRAYGAGERAQAAAACERATVENPQSLDAWEHLGRARQELGDPRGALTAWAQALNLAQGRASHLAVASALLWIEGGAPPQALGLLAREIPRTEAAGLAEGPGRTLRLLEARTLAQVGQLDAARQRAEALVAADPTHADSVYLRGTIRLGQRDLDGAEIDLRQALSLAPDHTAALSDLATLLAHQGRRDEARTLFQRVLALRPGDPLASQGLQRLGG